MFCKARVKNSVYGRFHFMPTGKNWQLRQKNDLLVRETLGVFLIVAASPALRH